MPKWYEKWKKLLDECKRGSRCNAIFSWHIENLQLMQDKIKELDSLADLSSSH